MGQVLKDREGRPLGHFLTHEEYMELIRAWAMRPFTKEDAEEAEKQVREWDGKSGMSSTEVLALIESWKENPPELSR
jgi:hypothetical protein